MKEWLKNQKLPGCQDAVDMIVDEAEFLRYHEKVWVKRDYFENGMNEEEKKIYDDL